MEAWALEAEGLAIRVEVHWAIWLRSGLLAQAWCQILVPKRDPFFEVLLDGLVMGGLGMGYVGIDRFFQSVCMFLQRVLQYFTYHSLTRFTPILTEYLKGR